VQEWFLQLERWHDFYVFAGTAAATLMGLMFVVMSLGQRTLVTEEGTRATRAFFTPIVVFFATIIVVTVLMLTPEASPVALAVLLAVAGAGGLIYMAASRAYTVWRTSELGFDDLLWYVVLPYLSYALIAAAAAAIWKTSTFGLYGMAAAVLLFLLIGIRNAWDLVIYNVQRNRE
jgi:hypothetical protein